MGQSSKAAAMEFLQVVTGWIDEGKSRGELREDVDSMLAVHTILNVWNAAMIEIAYRDESHPKCPSLADRIALLFDGLGVGD